MRYSLNKHFKSLDQHKQILTAYLFMLIIRLKMYCASLLTTFYADKQCEEKLLVRNKTVFTMRCLAYKANFA